MVVRRPPVEEARRHGSVAPARRGCVASAVEAARRRWLRGARPSRLHGDMARRRPPSEATCDVGGRDDDFDHTDAALVERQRPQRRHVCLQGILENMVRRTWENLSHRILNCFL